MILLTEGPNKDYWTTDCTAKDIREKYGLRRLRHTPLQIVLARKCCGKEFIHTLTARESVKYLADPTCMDPECRKRTVVMPFGKFAKLTLPLVYEQQPSYLA